MKNIHKRHGRTDGQRTYCGITALCVTWRGKNHSEQHTGTTVVGAPQQVTLQPIIEPQIATAPAITDVIVIATDIIAVYDTDDTTSICVNNTVVSGGN